MDQIAILVLTVPIVLPLIKSLGFDPIWFGVIKIVTAEVGMITPPIGLNCFIVARYAQPTRRRSVPRHVPALHRPPLRHRDFRGVSRHHPLAAEPHAALTHNEQKNAIREINMITYSTGSHALADCRSQLCCHRLRHAAGKDHAAAGRQPAERARHPRAGRQSRSWSS